MGPLYLVRSLYPKVVFTWYLHSSPNEMQAFEIIRTPGVRVNDRVSLVKYYITTMRVLTLQTNACSYIWVTLQTVNISNISTNPAALGLGRPWAATASWSNPAPNRGLYFINI